jgi:hypothetical protein
VVPPGVVPVEGAVLSPPPPPQADRKPAAMSARQSGFKFRLNVFIVISQCRCAAAVPLAMARVMELLLFRPPLQVRSPWKWPAAACCMGFCMRPESEGNTHRHILPLFN